MMMRNIRKRNESTEEKGEITQRSMMNPCEREKEDGTAIRSLTERLKDDK
jgi:hypothetical protein